MNNLQEIIEKQGLIGWVKDIFLIENLEENNQDILPFYADGYPGVMFEQSKNGAFLLPKNKKLSPLFMYGQSIQPIQISIEGSYRLIVFQLYPFAGKILFGINPKTLNDDCYDLTSPENSSAQETLNLLFSTDDAQQQIHIMATWLSQLVKQEISFKENSIRIAINLILQSKGSILISNLANQLHTTERTLQRDFMEYIGISPKQFAKIIQFHASLTKISDTQLSKLTSIVFESGYADQSHFIRDFKKYSGTNPSTIKKNI